MTSFIPPKKSWFWIVPLVVVITIVASYILIGIAYAGSYANSWSPLSPYGQIYRDTFEEFGLGISLMIFYTIFLLIPLAIVMVIPLGILFILAPVFLIWATLVILSVRWLVMKIRRK